MSNLISRIFLKSFGLHPPQCRGRHCEGWSPSMFARLAAMPGVFFLSYRKAGPRKKLPRLPAGDFALYQGEIDGQAVEYELADKSIHVNYGVRGKRKRLRLRR